MTPQQVLALMREKEVKAVDLRFMDFPGMSQHFTIPADALEESVFEEGLGFDGSSIRGWQAINESDMLVIPVPETAFIDPFFKDTTLVMICNIHDPITREDYKRDPRNIARAVRTPWPLPCTRPCCRTAYGGRARARTCPCRPGRRRCRYAPPCCS